MFVAIVGRLVEKDSAAGLELVQIPLPPAGGVRGGWLGQVEGAGFVPSGLSPAPAASRMREGSTRPFSADPAHGNWHAGQGGVA